MGYIANHKDKIEEIADGPLVPQKSYDYYLDLKEKTKRCRAKAIVRILKRQPYGKDLITEATALDNNSQDLQYLALMSSDIQAPELPDILKAMYGTLGEYFKDLLSPTTGK